MINYVTGESYSGNNLITLMQTDFPEAKFLTYRQALSIGRQVRKGEKGIPLMRIVSVREMDKNTKQLKLKKVPRYFTVFNIAQTDPVSA